MMPDITEIREWMDVAEGQLSDPQLSRIISAEIEDQASSCRVPLNAEDYPDALAMALLRRCARAAAARGIALGVINNSTEGAFPSAKIAVWDAEIQRYESKYPRLVVG